MQQTVEPADLRVIVLSLELVDIPGCLLVIGSGQQRNGLAHGFGLKQNPQLVGLRGVTLNQRRNHCAFVCSHTQQRLCLKLTQGFAHGHAADPEQIGQILLAQGGTAGQASIKDGCAQGFFNDRASQVRGNGPIDFNALQRFGLLCHDYAPCMSTEFGSKRH